MKKTIIILIVLIVIAAIGLAFTKNDTTPVETPTENVSTSTDIQVEGTVVSVNTDQVPVDGPALVTIETGSGSQAVVSVRSMGINLCPAQDNITNVYDLKVGDKVEAKGELGEEGRIIPCESEGHYLRVATE